MFIIIEELCWSDYGMCCFTVLDIVYSGYLYFVNHKTESSYIEVMKSDGSSRKIIYKTLTERPYRIAVDPKNRYHHQWICANLACPAYSSTVCMYAHVPT